MDIAEVSAQAGKLCQLLSYITFSTFTGLLDVGEVSHQTPTTLAELLLKTPQEPRCKRPWQLELPLSLC